MKRVYISLSEDRALFGFPSIQKLSVVKSVDALCSRDQWTPLQDDIFDCLEEVKDEYMIRLQPRTQPFSLGVPRRVLIPLHHIFCRKLDKLEADGVIRKVNDLTDWCSGIVISKSAGGYHICAKLPELGSLARASRAAIGGAHPKTPGVCPQLFQA